MEHHCGFIKGRRHRFWLVGAHPPVTGIVTDFRLTSDGVPIVIHIDFEDEIVAPRWLNWNQVQSFRVLS